MTRRLVSTQANNVCLQGVPTLECPKIIWYFSILPRLKEFSKPRILKYQLVDFFSPEELLLSDHNAVCECRKQCGRVKEPWLFRGRRIATSSFINCETLDKSFNFSELQSFLI
jgi:hypothetical protein